jgi:ElaB/YqjD/DUF883 family membrane-anchored ribosome-binding protein
MKMAQAMNTAARGKRSGNTRDAVKARAADVREDFGALRKDIGRLADAASTTLRHRASEGANYVSERVREHPGAAMGIMLGAGLLLGMLLAHR